MSFALSVMIGDDMGVRQKIIYTGKPGTFTVDYSVYVIHVQYYNKKEIGTHIFILKNYSTVTNKHTHKALK